MLQVVARRVASARYRRVLSNAMIRPQDEPRAGDGDPQALRVLLLGSGVASGQGVSTYGLALVGALQHVLQSRLNRPVDVELIRQHGAGVDHAAEIARSRVAEDWDAYVLAFGVNDALRLTPEPVWHRGLGLLLSTIEDLKRSPLQVPVVVAGIPPLRSFPAHEGMLLPLLQRHANRLNESTQRLLQRNATAFFVPLQSCRADGGRPFGYPDAYRAWADTLADQLVPLLSPVPERIAMPREGDRAGSAAQALLTPAYAELRVRLAELARHACSSLDGEYAAIRLVDGQRALLIADSLGSEPRSMPIGGSLFAESLVAGSLHVSDCALDPRIARFDQPARFGLRSYREQVLRDADGVVFGTVCVLNGTAAQDDAVQRLLTLAEDAAELIAAPGPAGARGRGRRAPDDDRAVRDGSVTRTGRDLQVLAGTEAVEPDRARPEAGWRRALLLVRGRSRLRSEGAALTATPRDRVVPAEHRLEIPGPAPIRVLMLGGEYATGYGAETRVDALDGALARLLHRRTGRGVVVENRADDTAEMHRLGDRVVAGDEVDLVVWTPVFAHALRTPSRRVWRKNVSSLIRRIRSTTDAGIVLMGFPMLTGRQPLAVLGRARGRRLNRLLREGVAGWRGVRVADAGPVALAGVASADGAAVYRLAATHMLEQVMDVLDHSSAPDELAVVG